MRKPIHIINAKILLENGQIEAGNILIKNGKIDRISFSDAHQSPMENTVVVDANHFIAIPGFIDMHIHGAYGADVMDATEKAIDEMAKALPLEGTTSFLATTMTASEQEIDRAVKNIGMYRNKRGHAEVLGIHIEGPFLEKSKAGAQRAELMLRPDMKLLNKWLKLSNNRVKVITIAPELDPSGEFIKSVVNKGILVSAGHTNANYKQIKTAQRQGVKQLTHLCNAMNGIHHRDIGAVGAAFLLEELKAELIVDGVHVSREMIELIYQNMGSERLILITDSLRAKGLTNGTYELGGQLVKVSDNAATLEDGTLAGSILKMNDAVKRMMEWTNGTLHDVVTMAAVNPAKQIGVYNRKGSIEVGKDADILLIDEDYRIHHVFCRGMIRKQEEE